MSQHKFKSSDKSVKSKSSVKSVKTSKRHVKSGETKSKSSDESMRQVQYSQCPSQILILKLRSALSLSLQSNLQLWLEVRSINPEVEKVNH